MDNFYFNLISDTQLSSVVLFRVLLDETFAPTEKVNFRFDFVL